MRDTDGPAENQPPEVQRLRGPYQHKHTAERAANKHFKAFRVTGHSAMGLPPGPGGDAGPTWP